VGPRAGLDAVMKGKKSLPLPGIEPRSLVSILTVTVVWDRSSYEERHRALTECQRVSARF